ncbi:MAG TPA: hypothetical protein VKT33_03270 [Candidatus Angelobacter sp.]|nr:hypothetical protein [Candidatus Angelobacter sp.]
MTPDLLARAIQEFFAGTRGGVVIEDAQVIFNLESAQYSISSERGKCLLHLWSSERNIVRQVMDADLKNGQLRLSVRGFAQARPHELVISGNGDRRAPAAKQAARARYARFLERILYREFSGWTLDRQRLATSMDLERSFSPVYARGLLRKGRSALAVLGVGQEESRGSVDAALTFGLLWLESCREREAGRTLVQGLRLYVPRRTSDTLRLRMAHLNRNLAQLQLCELDEGDESSTEIDCADHGNIDTRLVRYADPARIQAQFQDSIQKILAAVPRSEIVVLSPAQISFRLHGLEFAQTRRQATPGSFSMEDEIVFGVAGFSSRLTPENQPVFHDFANVVMQTRDLQGDHRDPLWRMYPERWLESLVVKDVTALDSRLEPAWVYSQVPAFSASDRAMIDVLACTRAGRLAVIELKADEDIHLPLQGLDYWARVHWHHQRGEFQQYGYFSGRELSSKAPLLCLAAPSLRVHPSVDTVLRYFSPAIEWTLAGLDERWREGIKVVFRKSADVNHHGN